MTGISHLLSVIVGLKLQVSKLEKETNKCITTGLLHLVSVGFVDVLEQLLLCAEERGGKSGKRAPKEVCQHLTHLVGSAPHK